VNKNKRGLIAISYRFLDENPDAVLKLFGEMAYCKHCLKQVDMANWRKE